MVSDIIEIVLSGVYYNLWACVVVYVQCTTNLYKAVVWCFVQGGGVVLQAY
jgi:hypothetical protein